ncbi:glutamate--tRNA ligase [Acuticoccus sp.]|uniref:glutamate--tRNA ligase n=1 Tax=Acuticoccus sp. TaxID=1904378 RepID=UPI003B52D1AF
MAEVVRFAPSPTGAIHIGNARTALYNFAAAVRSGGTFVLRYDDTDAERSEERHVAAIADDLAWLGMRPDRVVRQSERLPLYDAAAERLRADGLLYPCYETADELDRKRALQRARGLPPIYDRAALAMTAADRVAAEAEGRRPHWRFKLPGEARHWDDACRGPQTVNLDSVSDPVLVREDGSYLYTLPSVVDDAELGMTLVIRGEDHVTNTGVQLALFEALGAATPAFAHHNLLVRADGEPLSKRDNPMSLAQLRADGIEPMAVASLAVLVGTSHAIEPVSSMDLLVEMADLAAISRGPATFDPADLARLNAPIVHELPYESVAAWLLDAHGIADASLWNAVRGNLERRDDVADWAQIVREGPSHDAWEDGEDAGLLEAARAELPPAPWDEGTFKAWTDAVKARSGCKGRALFMPLRVALTGRRAGPEMGPLLPLIGPEGVARRLDRALALARTTAAG